MRIFFTEEMWDATVAGKKSETTRDHQKALGVYDACTGSWHNPKSVKVRGTIEITSNGETTWSIQLGRFRREGFDSIEQFKEFAKRTGLDRYASAPHLYRHEYILTAQSSSLEK